jgi:hypothetical protein
MPGEEPKIDFTQIQFPSDKLTIGMLRKAWPETADIDRETDFGRAGYRSYVRQSLDGVLGEGLLDPERLLAERTFKAMLGLPIDEKRIDSRDVLIKDLRREYLFLGIARGKHEVRALIRSIEEQAEAQARQYGGRPR